MAGFVLSAVVTLASMKIYRTHEWLNTKPTVYFHCQGEKNKTELPDVKEVNVSYAFKGEESWQVRLLHFYLFHFDYAKLLFNDSPQKCFE